MIIKKQKICDANEINGSPKLHERSLAFIDSFTNCGTLKSNERQPTYL
jgi:hypothetical protein